MRSLIVRKPTLLPSMARHRSRRLAQALAQAAAKEHVLIQIQPKTLEFLDDCPVDRHVVQALLALQHRNLQVLQLTPPRFQVPTVMPITGELVGITTATRPALPINGARVPTHTSRFAFSSAQLGFSSSSRKALNTGLMALRAAALACVCNSWRMLFRSSPWSFPA